MKTMLLVIVGVLWLAGIAQFAAAADEKTPSQVMQEYITHQIRFAPFCFRTAEFPSCDFDDPEAVRALIGPYSISCTFYDGEGKVVKSAEKPGRYAAVVEIHRAGGVTSKRFVTLARLADAAPADASNAAPLDDSGIDKDVRAGRANELERATRSRAPFGRPGANPQVEATRREATEAVVVAGLYDLTALKVAGQPLPDDSMARLDRQWWVRFKRAYYGYDRMFPNAFVSPEPLRGQPARVLREGPLAEAGMAEDSVARIDAACEKWVSEIGVGFSLCVARHGVVVLNKGYGKKGGRGSDQDEPFTADTAGPLASATKFLSSTLLTQFVDRGLIGLDEPVGVYLPALRNIESRTTGRPLTVRDCYLHLADFNGQWGDTLNDMEEVIADLYPTLNIGLTHRYDGVGIALGGKIMEAVSGDSIPRLYRKHLLDPLGCSNTDLELTAYGSTSTAFDLVKIGQMMLNDGAYGDKRFFRPGVHDSMMPIPGRDRFLPDTTVRWGVGIKQFDIDGLSEEAFGHPGASGSCVVVDPARDLVIGMVRFTEGPDFQEFLKKKSVMYKAIMDCIAD